jgi:hypothetical protein
MLLLNNHKGNLSFGSTETLARTLRSQHCDVKSDSTDQKGISLPRVVPNDPISIGAIIAIS